MKRINLTPSVILFCLLVTSRFSSFAQCGTCNLTQANLLGGPGSYTIPAGQTLCITSDFCMGATSNWPGSCSNTAVSTLTINGTLTICNNVTFKFSGSIVGTGKVQIMSAGRFSLYGTYDCSMGLVMTAVDPTISSGTSNSSLIGSCNSAACEPHFSNGYAPLGVVATGLGYTVNGACTATGYPNNFILLPAALTSWKAGWQGKAIRLEWTIPAENNKSFEVEYASDGHQWHGISGALPVHEAGGPQNYAYTAAGSFAETNYFRLKITGHDGSYTYSPVEMVAGSGRLRGGIVISPNPVQSTFTLRREGTAIITGLRLIDMAGITVLRLPYNANGQYQVDKLAPGTYFLQVSLADGSRATGKITKL